MTTLTLKEQLQALSLGSSSKPEREKNNKSQKNLTKTDVGTKKKPTWLEHAQYGVELLKAHFPMCFKEQKEMKPLKVGIKQDLVKHLSSREDIVLGDKACMVNSLSYYVGSLAYHKNIVEGASRFDLEGNPCGLVTADEASYSRECRENKLKKKNKLKEESL